MFGSFEMTGFIVGSLMFSLLPSLAPYRVMLAVPPRPYGFDFIYPVGYIVGKASNSVLPRLLAPLGYSWGNTRLSIDFINLSNYLHDFTSHA
jgi:hypothetical protein